MKKIVLKLDVDDDKQKQKAFKAVAGLQGIDEMGVDMMQQRMTIVGTVDPVAAVGKLRKLFPTTEIVSVVPVRGNKQQLEEIQYLQPPVYGAKENLICWPNNTSHSNKIP